MKNQNIVLSFCFILLIQFANAQNPEPIYSFATELKPVSWYNEQVKAWKNEIDKNKNNAYAWYNYYRATRNLARLDTTDNRERNDKWIAEKKIVEDMSKIVPESFEYNLCQWMVGGNDLKYFSYLKKAAELGENRPEIVSDMINWGETERDLKMRDKYAKIWYESNLASPGLLNYNYNVIIGLKPNAILLTVGDNDTYPIWQLQSQGIRKDITVLNLSLLNIDTYRDKIFKELNIAKWDTAMHSGKSIHDHNPYHAEIIKHIAANAKKLPVYVALTTGPEYTKSIENELYLTGLSYEYSLKSIDNLALLKKNFEQLYALDYLDKTFYKDISAYYAVCVNQNYIVPMLKLYDHYLESGDLQKQEWIKNKILILAKCSEDETAIKNHFKQ
ncbi:MAG: hypothetical protein ACOYMA_20440 [Bacteroidia bacterium]